MGLFFTICAALGVGLFLSVAVLAQQRPTKPPVTTQHEGRALYRVDFPQVHDADTLADGVIRLPFGAAIAGRSIRADFDAWEITKGRQTVKVTDEEIAKGKAARDALVELLRTSTLYVSELPKGADVDPYDRIDSVWWLRSADGRVTRVADWARGGGHLRR
jgi:hypothetical protein